MAIKIFVGNLPFRATEDEVRNLFAAHGEVLSVSLINDRDTGRPRGFGFVEMDDSAGMAAIEAINGVNLGGRPLQVNQAREREARPPRSGGGYGGGDRGGDRGGYGGGDRGGYGGGERRGPRRDGGGYQH